MVIVTTPFQVIFEKIVDYTIGVVARQMGYLIRYRSNVDNLKTEVSELKDARESVDDMVKAARNNKEEIEANFLKWLTSVEEITTEVQKFFEEEDQTKLKCCHGWRPNLKARYQLSKRAYKMGLDVKKIQNKGTFHTIRGVTPIPTKGFEDFESRKSILEGIMKALKDDNIHTIGVCGMGGLGKTMLVGKVATQAKEEMLFETVVTVVVSQSPNLKQIQKDIAEELDLKFEDEDTDVQKAHLLHKRLKKEKILIIVDDIWKKLNLEALGISFGDDQKGSKLLLTSRFRNVLETDMDAQQLFYVETLSKNEAEYLFAKIVGDLPETLNLQPTMVEVVKECAGLPVAITAVANALKNQKNLNVWKDALRELKRANPTQIQGMHEKVYSSIKLSYNFLTKEAQSLFLFCSSFEEDMNIQIAFLWRILVGLEFFQNVYTVEDVRNRVHTLVERLKASGLLLDGNGSGTFKMHDVIRDVAISIADKDKEMLTIRTSDDLQKWSNMKLLKDFIGISLFDVKFSELPKKLDDAQLNFIFLYDKDNSSPIPNHFFERVKELRVLVLQGLCLPLPSSLSCLHNLQALVLHRCEIEDVAIIGELKKLKALTISTSTKKLPMEIRQLTHLQLLDLKGCNQLEVIPCNMLSNLKRLEELYLNGSFNQWHVDGESTERSNARVLELDHLSRLTTLCIHIPNAKILPKALLFENLVRYKILIGSDWDWNDDSGQNEDEFKISKKLKIELDRNFQSEGGIKILLKSCEYLDLQPGKGIRSILYEVDQEGFPQLKHLYVRNSVEIQYIINSIGGQQVAFPILESISLSNMSNLEKICHDQLATGSFRYLKNFVVGNCDNLRFVFSSSMVRCFSQLKNISIWDCKVMSEIVAKERENEINVNDNVMVDIIEFTQLRSFYLRGLPNLMGFYYDDDSYLLFNAKVAFPNLEKITINNINNLKMMWHNQLVRDSFCKLQRLDVYNCENLMNIFPPNMLRRLQNLETLEVQNCNSVEEVFEIRGVNVNEICDMVSIQLRNLYLSNLPKLKHVWSSDPQTMLTFQNLREVRVSSCKSLKSLFPASVAKSLEQLEELYINDCGLEEIVAMEEGLETTTKFVFPRLISLSLEMLPDLKCFYQGKHTLEWLSLKKLEIYKCDKVKIVASNDLNFPNTKELGHHLPIQQSLFLIEKDTLSNLEELKLDWDDTMNQTCGRLLTEFFCELKVLKLYCKDDRSTAFPWLIVQRLYNLKELYVYDFFDEEICACGLVDMERQYSGSLERLMELHLSKMPKLMHVWNENSQKGRAFQNLEILSVSDCGRLKNLMPSSLSFQNLNSLKVSSCHGLMSLLTSSVVKSLVKLTRMEISGCKRMEEIVTNEEGGEAGDEICFSQLKFLRLDGLPILRSFHLGNHTIKFPSLVDVYVNGCPELKIFSNGVLRMPKLKDVRLGENYNTKWWPVSRQQLREQDFNTIIKRFWEENFDTCVGQLFTEKSTFREVQQSLMEEAAPSVQDLSRLALDRDLAGLLKPPRVVFDDAAVKRTSHSSERTKFEIEEIGDEASQMNPEESLTDEDWTGPLERLFAEEGSKEKLTLEPQAVVFDVEAVMMTSNSSEQTKFEIEEIGDEASQMNPEGIQESLTDEDWTGPLERLFAEEGSKEKLTLEPRAVVFDVEAVKMTSNSSEQTKFEIEEIGNEAPQTRQPEGIQVVEMQTQAISTLEPQRVVFAKPPKDEDWENAKEIYLMDNELSVLPENPRCPELSALFILRNYKLRKIPPSFFDHMPALQILNLSRTGIKSLPDSIISLVSLKRLFLNDCHRFMGLSPKVGELKQLEVLDLEGTEIMDLPQEIEKLTNLTCLEVSFCGTYVESNVVVIPCGVISALSQLEELNIDVDPDDERWDACVEAIVNEVCTLKRLETLKFYFPRLELLRNIQMNIPSLFNFRFIVGRHVKRLMSRIPPDVEIELERWEGYLKYINGVGVPREIQKVLQHATAFFLDRHASIKKISDFGNRNMEELKCLVIGECNEVQVIIDQEDDSNEVVSEKIVLGSLEYMYVYYMKSLRSIWEGSVQRNSLCLLKSLTLVTCPELTTIFTQGLLANLCNLEELKVEDCSSINNLVSFEISAEQKASDFLPNLKKISLHYMPGLVSISGGLHIAPKLEWLSFYNCPNLKNPLIDEVSTQDLKKIKGERSWWEALEWSNGCPGYLDEIFVQIDIFDC